MYINTQKIMEMLAEQGLTQAALAQRCGIGRQLICTILKRGSCAPKTAGKLAAGLGVPVREIAHDVRFYIWGDE